MKRQYLLPALCLTLGLSVNAAKAQQVGADANTQTKVDPYIGNVNATGQYDNGWLFWNEARPTSITLEPGRGQISMDHLSVGDNVVLTLVNPTDLPMRFETTQRLGSEKVWMVPAKSSKVVTYVHTNPVNDEVKYFVTVDPASAVAAMNQPDPTKTALDELRTQQEELLSQQQQMMSEQQRMAAMMEEQQRMAAEKAKVESRSAVRGYW